MPAQYETCFAITGAPAPGGGGPSGPELLREVVEHLRSELQAGPETAAESPDVETGATETAAYARLSAERPYPPAPQYRVRLEARLCTSGSGVEAEIQCRFLSADGAAPPDASAGPPRLLPSLMTRFPCSDGGVPWAGEILAITPGNARAVAAETILNPQRRRPILAISQDRRGQTAIPPETVRRALLGLATVARLQHEASSELTRYLGRWFSCANGDLQILWPGCTFEANGTGPRVQYKAAAVRDESVARWLREWQQICIDHAPDSGFDLTFSNARTAVILERNRTLESQLSSHPPAAALPDAGELETLRRELRRQKIAAQENHRKWQNALGAAARLEQELAAEQDRNRPPPATAAARETPADDDRELSRKLRAENRELRQERDELRKTNDRLNADNQLLRQHLRQAQQTEGEIRPAYPHPGYVTLLNYALNLYRDPMRRYIISNLGADDDLGLLEILRQSVEFNINAFQHTAALPEALPESLIDVNDFHNIIADNYIYFEDSRNLAWTLRQIRDVRNKAAHPPPGGISSEYAQDGLAHIIKALETIGARPELLELRRLRERIHPN